MAVLTRRGAGMSTGTAMTARPLAAVGLLAAACCAWAAWPLAGTGQSLLLVLAGLCAAGDLARLVTAALPVQRVDSFSHPALRLARGAHGALSQLPLAEAAVLAVLGLELAHPSRPWHTGLLGAALLCYLLAIHLAESGAPARVLRPQLPALAAGLGQLVLGTAAALVPAAAPGLASGTLRVLAAIAAIAAGALALPL
jgi:hypothetical protein